jgi:small nuclear ribonucleoprotein (snRNP)-like protein
VAGNGNGTPNGNGTGSGDPSSGGNAPATEVLVTSSTRRVVTAKLDAVDQQIAARGRRVRVELPDGRIVSGLIASVGTVATTDANQAGDPGGGDTTPKITVTIRLRSARAAGRLDETPVSVQFARTTRRNVLAVPVQALVARPGGRYALERADGRLVDVVPGLFADGYVELTDGRIRAGDRVRVPA